MSLDVCLKAEPVQKKGTGVFIRENGQNRELTEQEVKERWPGAEISTQFYEDEYVYSRNITHNLNRMAEAAGIYEALWRPYRLKDNYEHSDDDYQKEIAFEGSVTILAKEIIAPLQEGLEKLKSNPEEFKKYNPENGWGTYGGLIDFVEDYLNACIQNPEAEVITLR